MCVFVGVGVCVFANMSTVPLLGTHMIVFRGLQQYPEQPVCHRAAAQRLHSLIQVLLGLQGLQQLKGQENMQHMTFHSPLFHNGNGM